MKTSQFKSMLRITMYIVIITFVVDKAVYYTLGFLSDKVLSGQAIGKLNHYLLLKDNVDLISFGNSRTNRHINTKKINDRSFNMGIDGTSIAYSATAIKLLPKDKKQTVIVNIDTKNAFYKSYKGLDVSSLKVRYHRDKIIKEEIDKVALDDLIQKFYWSKGYNGKVLGIIKNLLIPKYDYTTYFGYDPITVNETQKKIFQNYLKLDKPVNCKETYKMGNLFEYYLTEIKSFCESNNKRLIVITAPLYQDKCKGDNEVFSKILKKLDVEYYDFTDFFRQDNRIEYWKDEEHLSIIGAELFSDMINNLVSKSY